jgi:hypothetical protein
MQPVRVASGHCTLSRLGLFNILFGRLFPLCRGHTSSPPLILFYTRLKFAGRIETYWPRLLAFLTVYGGFFSKNARFKLAIVVEAYWALLLAFCPI